MPRKDETHVEVSIYLTLRAKREKYSTPDEYGRRAVWAATCVKATATPPKVVPGDSVITRVQVRIPKAAFNPQTILATIPVDLIQRPIEASAIEIENDDG